MKFRGVTLTLLLIMLSIAPLQAEVLRMATTTSTDNTGLLDYLAPAFQADTGIELQWVAVGTGKALALGKNCDIDVLLVHAPGAERQYIADGFGLKRREVMYNDFIIIGPASDPAMIKGLQISEAFRKIAQSQNKFASRGDNSGTNKKELLLWQAAQLELPDKQPWYIQTGQGMINTINIAAERDAYTLTDRGTYIKYADNHKGNPPLAIIVEGSELLRNQYSVLILNDERCPNIKQELAGQFSDWIASKRAQQLIAEFRLLNKQLFIPNAK